MKKRLLSSLLVLCMAVSVIFVSAGSAGAASVSYSGTANEPIVYDYIVNDMGLNTAAACGIMANIMKESNFIPTIGTSHYGLCQWSATRTSNMKSYCSSHGYDYTTVIGQMHFLEYELETLVPDTLKCLQNVPNTADGAYTAGYNFCYYFEIPGSRESSSVKRGNIAKEFFAAYSSIAQDGSSSSSNSNSNSIAINTATYTAYATTANVNYRTGPGTSYTIAGTLSSGKTVMVEDGYSSTANGYTWYRVLINGSLYYMASNYLTNVAGATSSGSGLGFVKENGAWYYYGNGKATDIVEDTTGAVSGTGKGGSWYYIVNGKIAEGYTGVTNVANNSGWWYVENGKVDFGKTSVEQNNYGWWRVVDGKVDFSCNSVEQNDYGWWRIVNGKVDFSCNSVEQNSYGWWYIVGGKVQFGYTGVANYANSSGWWYIKDGKVDFSKTGVEQNNNGWWRVVDGKVDFSCNSVEQNGYGWWYIVDGKVQFGYTGVSNYANVYGWWYIKDGKVDFSKTGIEPNDYGWWRVEDGEVDFSYNGWAKNNSGTWYCVNGKVDFSKS